MFSTTLAQPAKTVPPNVVLAAEPPSATAASDASRKADAPPGLPPLTRPARGVLTLVAVLFVVSVGLRLNGSSSTFWESKTVRSLRVSDAPSGLLAGTPKFTRGDEWFVWTPAIIAQAHQPEPFPVANPSLGPGVTPLLMSLPTRYYTTALRPGLWAFFVAPLDYAFSWYWSLKVFGLFAALFTLFWTLTAGRLGLSIFGALAVQFSGFVQWWFSTPAMMPEMLTAWSLGIVTALSFFTGRSWRWQAFSAGVFVLCLANFCLCCYPAFEIPLLHLAGCLLGGYVWQRRLFSKTAALWLAGSFVATLLLLAPWFLRCLPTLQIEAHTIYPGQRHTYGGALGLVRYLSGLFTLGMDETTLPRQLENICEASNFYPLWLLPLGLGWWAFVVRLGRGRAQLGVWLADRGMKVLLAGYLTLLSLYAFFPLPHWFCDATLLSRTTEGRSLLTLGVAGTVFLVLCLASRPPNGRRLAAVRKLIARRIGVGGWIVTSGRDAKTISRVAALIFLLPFRFPKTRWSRPARWAALFWSVGVFLFLATQQEFLSMQHELVPGHSERFIEFLTPGTLTAFAATAVLAAVAYLFAPRWIFPTAWAVALMVKFALVNPVCVGVPALLQSPTMNRLHALVQAHPTAAWAVYGSVQGVELVKSSGAHVVNGLRIVPDFSIIDRLDPAHQHLDAYNQYSSLYFADAPYQHDVPVSIFSLRYCRIALHPRRMRELFPEVRYVVATEPMPDLAEAGFALLARVPESRLWLYALASGSAVTN